MTNSTQTKTANPTSARIDIELTGTNQAQAHVYNGNAPVEHFAEIATGHRAIVIAIACQLSRVSGIPVSFVQVGGEQFAKQAGETWTTTHDRLHADGDCICFDS